MELEPTAQDEHFMRLALAEAQAALEQDEVPVGAVIVLPPEAIKAARLNEEHRWHGSSDTVVAGHGGNRTRRDGVVHAHAELVALAQAERSVGQWRLEGAWAYVTLEPCLMCLGALQQARVARVVYGASEPKFGALESCFTLGDHNAFRNMSFSGGVLAQESAELLSSFFGRLRSGRAVKEPASGV